MVLEYSNILVCEVSLSLYEHCVDQTWTQGTECFIEAAPHLFPPTPAVSETLFILCFQQILHHEIEVLGTDFANYWCEVNVLRDPPFPPELLNPMIVFTLIWQEKSTPALYIPGLSWHIFQVVDPFRSVQWKTFSTWNNGTHIFHSIFLLHTAKIIQKQLCPIQVRDVW